MSNQPPMPRAVRMSAYCNRKMPIAAFFGKIEAFMDYALGFAVYFAWWIYAYALLTLNDTINYFFSNNMPGVTKFIVASFAVCLVWGVLGHWLEVERAVPRADPSYPLVGSCDEYGFPEEICKLAYHMLAFAVVLSLTIRSTKDWWFAGLTFGMGCFAIWYGKNPPTYGHVPYDGYNERNPIQYIIQAPVSSTQPTAQPVAAPATDTSPEYATPVQATEPKTNFSNIFGMQAIKDKLLEPAQLIIAERKPQDAAEPPANGILLHGEPGNGKTVFAEALAGELKVPFVQLTYGDVSSKWVGEMPRLITNCFAYAKQHAPCVLFVDEIDSFIRSRDAAGSNEESLKITNTLLTEVVNLRNHRVVLIGATNYLANLDAAAIREGRFDYKIEITPPDEPARIGILQKGVAKHAQHLNVNQDDLLSVAKRWNGFSVSRLLAVVKAIPRYAKDHNLSVIGHDEWMGTLREVQGRNGRVPQNTKSLAELILDTPTREALTMVSSRLKDVARIESLGGTLPSGVLFHGPSGTGKTAAARAVAKEVGWAFLSVAGPDLMADREKISKIYAEAKDIRPCLIFIDEADDVLRNRQYSNTPDLTNRMLVLMDGTDEKVKDVVFIAATNHPDQIDPALLRAGRFTEKVEFTTPPQDQIPRFVSNWLKGKKVMLDAGLDVFEITALLEGQTIANIEGVLQYALNRAISRKEGKEPMVISLEDVTAGKRIVLSEGEST